VALFEVLPVNDPPQVTYRGSVVGRQQQHEAKARLNRFLMGSGSNAQLST